MRIILFPILGAALGFIGAFTPMSSFPAGGVLTVCAVLGLLSLFRAKAPRTAELRTEAFWHSALVGAVLAMGAGFLMHPWNDAENWARPAVIYSCMVALAVLVISGSFMFRVRRILKRDEAPRSLVRTISLSMLILLWVVGAFSQIGFGALYATANLINHLTPPVRLIAVSYAESPDEFLEGSRDVSGGISVTVNGINARWACEGEPFLTMSGAHMVTTDLDQKVLSTICAAAPSGRP